MHTAKTTRSTESARENKTCRYVWSPLRSQSRSPFRIPFQTHQWSVGRCRIIGNVFKHLPARCPPEVRFGQGGSPGSSRLVQKGLSSPPGWLVWAAWGACIGGLSERPGRCVWSAWGARLQVAMSSSLQVHQVVLWCRQAHCFLGKSIVSSTGAMFWRHRHCFVPV